MPHCWKSHVATQIEGRALKRPLILINCIQLLLTEKIYTGRERILPFKSSPLLYSMEECFSTLGGLHCKQTISLTHVCLTLLCVIIYLPFTFKHEGLGLYFAYIKGFTHNFRQSCLPDLIKLFCKSKNEPVHEISNNVAF